MKKKPKSQQSQPDNASPPESASLVSKCRTPRKNTAEPTDPTYPTRSSPRFKQSAEPTDANTSQRRSSTRLKESAEPTNPESTTQTPWPRQPGTAILTSSSRNTLAFKRTTVLTYTKSKEDAGNSKEGRKKVKRNLDTSTGPCRDVQLRNPNDTLSDFEEEDEILQPNKDVQEEEGFGTDCGSFVTDDLLTKALDEDIVARLKGTGFGVTCKKITSNTHYKLIIKECQETCRAMNDRLVMLEVGSFSMEKLLKIIHDIAQHFKTSKSLNDGQKKHDIPHVLALAHI